MALVGETWGALSEYAKYKFGGLCRVAEFLLTHKNWITPIRPYYTLAAISTLFSFGGRVSISYETTRTKVISLPPAKPRQGRTRYVGCVQAVSDRICFRSADFLSSCTARISLQITALPLSEFITFAWVLKKAIPFFTILVILNVVLLCRFRIWGMDNEFKRYDQLNFYLVHSYYLIFKYMKRLLESERVSYHLQFFVYFFY